MFTFHRLKQLNKYNAFAPKKLVEIYLVADFVVPANRTSRKNQTLLPDECVIEELLGFDSQRESDKTNMAIQ